MGNGYVCKKCGYEYFTYNDEAVTTAFWYSEDEEIWKLDVKLTCPECTHYMYIFIPMDEFMEL